MLKRIGLLLSIALLLASCGTSKGVPDNKIIIESTVVVTKEVTRIATKPPMAKETATPQPSPTVEIIKSISLLKRVEVQIWPDYDDPSVLVLISGLLPDEAIYPATVTIPIPKDAKINAVARFSEGMLFDDIDYDVDDSDQLTLTTPDPSFRIEYYSPYDIDEDVRSYSFLWQSELTIGEMTISVQKPLLAQDFQAHLPAIDIREDETGFAYFNTLPVSIQPTEPYSLNFSYKLEPSRLSVDELANRRTGQKQPAVIITEELDDGWTRYLLSESDFAITLPSDWIYIDPAAGLNDGLLEEIGELNPDMLGILSNDAVREMALQGIVFMAVDLSTFEGWTTTPASINIMVVDPALFSIEVLIGLTTSQLESIYDLAEPIRVERLRIDGIPAAKLSYQIELTSFTGTESLDYTQYLVVKEDKQFIVTFGSNADISAKSEDHFKNIIRNFEWVESS